MAKIYAPNKAYNGITATVRFINGEGETENPKLLKWFTRKGYHVDEVKDEESPQEEITTISEETTDSISEQETAAESTNKYDGLNVDELKEIAKKHKIKGYSSMLRPQLIEALQEIESE